MNVACGACPAKYVIPDEKVRGRKVRIPCKRCGAAIVIDGTAISLSGGEVATQAQPLLATPGKSYPVTARNEAPGDSPIRPRTCRKLRPVGPVQDGRNLRRLLGLSAP